ncbi:UDP-glucose 4-epimerase GalE [Geminicoccaceae bacterium 1502E]|nr:UDP-glucose 4-epimerase GalE [Geminicoccaceae bacterium 1502E]
MGEIVNLGARRPAPAGSRGGSVLVTGGCGYIGSHVVLALLAAGWRVAVLDDLSTGRVRPLHRACEVVVGDIADSALLARTLARHDVVAVVHLAARLVAPESVRQPLDYYRVNTAGSLTLIETCVEHGLGAFVFSSTAAVYGSPRTSPVDEETEPRPVNPYGGSKLAVERMLADAERAFDLPYAALRYFNVAGADPHGRAGHGAGAAPHLIRVACQAALGQRDAVPIFGTDYPTADGTCVRDYVHVSDLADAHVAMLDHLLGGGPSSVVNIGYGRGRSVREVVDAVQRVAGCRLPVRLAPRRAGDPAEVVASNARLRRMLDWRPRFADLDLMIGHALAWEKQLLDESRRPTTDRAAGA